MGLAHPHCSWPPFRSTQSITCSTVCRFRKINWFAMILNRVRPRFLESPVLGEAITFIPIALCGSTLAVVSISVAVLLAVSGIKVNRPMCLIISGTTTLQLALASCLSLPFRALTPWKWGSGIEPVKISILAMIKAISINSMMPLPAGPFWAGRISPPIIKPGYFSSLLMRKKSI